MHVSKLELFGKEAGDNDPVSTILISHLQLNFAVITCRITKLV